jgi:hypothetical protein
MLNFVKNNCNQIIKECQCASRYVWVRLECACEHVGLWLQSNSFTTRNDSASHFIVNCHSCFCASYCHHSGLTECSELFVISQASQKNVMFVSWVMYFSQYLTPLRPPLWSSGQSSWLQIRRPGFDSRHYQKKK